MSEEVQQLTYQQYQMILEVSGWNMMKELPPLSGVAWNEKKR